MYIDAKDLRIGNYTMTDGKINRIDYNFEITDDHKGIFLSEELIIKMGWVWNEECKCYEKFPDGNANTMLHFVDVSNSYTMFNYVSKIKIRERIFFVHQLQNLYYALTGKELNGIQKPF